MNDFHVKTLKLPDDIVVVAPIGKLDSVTTVELEKAVQKYLDTQIYSFIFDLSKIESITSAGIGFFAKLTSITAENHGAIVAIQPPPAVQEAMNIFGIFRYMPLVDNLDTALRTITKTKTGQFRRPNL